MDSVQLIDIAHGRSGDKGNTVNIGIIARDPKWYPLLVAQLTEEVVAEHFKDICVRLTVMNAVAQAGVVL